MYSSFFKLLIPGIILLTLFITYSSIQITENPNSISQIPLTNQEFLWPTPGITKISCCFGPRKAPTPGASIFHYGIDISAPEGTKLYSCVTGTIHYVRIQSVQTETPSQ